MLPGEVSISDGRLFYGVNQLNMHADNGQLAYGDDWQSVWVCDWPLAVSRLGESIIQTSRGVRVTQFAGF
jgi:hypothetical protein